ncbi:MAG TPA: hypothetical protein VFC59_09965, partial [Cryobacterium sp.]|nr:hypothetical protein [Cryobacterium sp.]
MRNLRFGLGPLGRRLLLAFILVAGSSVLVLTGAALIGVESGVQVAQQADRERIAEAAAAAAADAYRQAGGWEQADLSRTTAIAEAASARLAVLDAGGATIQTTGTSGGPGTGAGSG